MINYNKSVQLADEVKISINYISQEELIKVLKLYRDHYVYYTQVRTLYRIPNEELMFNVTAIVPLNIRNIIDRKLYEIVNFDKEWMLKRSIKMIYLDKELDTQWLQKGEVSVAIKNVTGTIIGYILVNSNY